MADQQTKIKLPVPKISNDKLLSDALHNRKSSREFTDREISLQELSNILWCANGINRPESGRRTSPSAMNIQDIDVYVVIKEGIYRYLHKETALELIVAGDFRKEMGFQEFVATAPLNLIYVTDYTKFEFTEDTKVKAVLAAVDAAHCSENVYLYAAAAGLGVVVRAAMDTAKVAGVLKLRPEQAVVIAQTVGYEK